MDTICAVRVICSWICPRNEDIQKKQLLSPYVWDIEGVTHSIILDVSVKMGVVVVVACGFVKQQQKWPYESELM